ncbi:cytochrome P450 [Streptomyces sp. KM273126]|uniref:cytochrome P450 n=1 Tax=Streptomyces sp. KM273126 TaxID=2545247 RepID=UPI00103B0856|nr:cytochrome P450 [Streptomyces sp. KM273126]MBA2810711.1 cytochrome P450 [Streptomyces sp. KM273126]
MTITSNPAEDRSADSGILSFPMDRAAGCPFDPPPRLQAQQQEEPLSRVRIWDGSTPWFVTRHADQRALLGDPRVSADAMRPGYPRSAPSNGRNNISFILMDDPEHARLRRMVTGSFAVKRVQAMRPAVQKIVDDLIDDMLAGPNPVDLVQAFALPVPSLVICELLGVPYDDHDFFQRNSSALVKQSLSVEERTAAHGALLTYLDDLMGEKLAHPADDLLSSLVTRVKDGELSRNEAAQMGVLLLLAGHETTANMIALGTVALLEHPDQLAQLRDADDPKAIAAAVEELLRYLNVTHSGRRRVALEDIEVAGEVIRAGEGIVFPNEIANRDPEVFTDPDHLDLGRDARRHVAFGFGVHQCLGQPLARLELQVVYSTLYRRVPTLRLATEAEKLPYKHDGAVYGVYELPVAW